MLFNRHSRSNALDRHDDVLAGQLICAEKVGCRAFTAKSHHGVSAEAVRRLSASALLHLPVSNVQLSAALLRGPVLLLSVFAAVLREPVHLLVGESHVPL